MTDQAEFAFQRAPRSNVAAAFNSAELVRESEVQALFSSLTLLIAAQLALKQDLDTELTALASTTSAADKLPYYTGSGTAGTTDLTSFARTLLDDADAATARATLGVPSEGVYRTVRVATTANGTLSTAYENGDTIDGVTLATNDEILIKNQTTQTENGLYRVNASGSPTRLANADSDAELRGVLVAVREGSTNRRTLWWNTNNSAITIGSTNVTFSSFINSLGLGALAFQNDLDVSQLVDASVVGGVGEDGAILFWRGGTLQSSGPPPAGNYSPYYDGTDIQWIEVFP